MLAGINGDAYNSSYRDPLKTINYASVHDNLTLYDQLQGTVGVNDAQKASVAVNALVTFSIGTVFLHAGEEIMRTKIAGPQDDPDTYYVINGKNISHNSYKSPDSTNSFKWNLKITYYAQFQNYQRMIALRLAIPSFTVNDANAVALQGRPQGQMGFWDGPLAYSTIAAWYTKDPNNIYYVFANARQSLSSGPLTSQVIWGNTSDQVEILFDSLNDYPVGTKLNGFVLLKPFQVLLVKR
jgi:pullulanase/glycogen debranching enzyme